MTNKKQLPLNLQRLSYSLGILVVIAALMFAGCNDSTNVEESPPEIVDIIIKPNEANIEVGGNVDFSVVAVTDAGNEIPIPQNFNTTWSSTNSVVFTVEENGTATGQAEGTAFCVIEVSGEVAENKQNHIHLIFTGRDSAFVSVP